MSAVLRELPSLSAFDLSLLMVLAAFEPVANRSEYLETLNKALVRGGTGLNLTAADYVIHLDPWWNPAVESQATDRAHRIGQRRPVTVYRLVMAGTVEQRILALHGEREPPQSICSTAPGRRPRSSSKRCGAS